MLYRAGVDSSFGKETGRKVSGRTDSRISTQVSLFGMNHYTFIFRNSIMEDSARAFHTDLSLKTGKREDIRRLLRYRCVPLFQIESQYARQTKRRRALNQALYGVLPAK